MFEGSMARRRYQKGQVYLCGQMWYGRYREDVIRDGRVKRVRKNVPLGTKREYPTKRLAERRMEQVLSRINAFEYRPGRVATIGEFSERWITEVLSRRKPSTQKTTGIHLNHHIVPHLGKLRLDAVGVENQQAFVNALAEKLARKTVFNIIGTLSSMLTTAKNWGYVCEGVDIRSWFFRNAAFGGKRAASRLTKPKASSPQRSTRGSSCLRSRPTRDYAPARF